MRPLSMRQRILVVAGSNMAKKGRRNSQKKKKNSKANEDIDDENGDEDGKRCPHISKSVKLQNLQNKVPHTTLGQCLNCGELDSSEGLGVCICLCCAHQGCDRNSEEKHSLSHNKSYPSHNIVVHLQNWVVWCYTCDDEVPVEPESALHNCIKLILKAMNLSPPPELEVSLSSPNKESSGDKPKKGDLKNSSQLRSQIKGLTNLGNTCFFNAVMQNLCQTELLHVAASCSAQEAFSQHVSPKNKDLAQLTVTVQEGPGSVTKALWKLLQEFRSSNSGTLTPRQLFGEICKTATRFKGYRQQDSQELLRYLLDSIRNEEIRRVKLAVLKSFGVTGGDNAKNLDDNKKAQVKEYGACAEAPLIDSVFAGRLVSIVICRQCHKEFKVEETFLDLSLPLTAPQQESWNNKIFGKGVKQNPKSPKSANNKDESTIVKDNDTKTGADSKAKSPSKHQLKSARKAERKKGKKGKGHGKTGKGKSSEEPIDNKQADNDADEDEKGESEDEGHELDQMNVSDLDGSDNEQEHELIDNNNAAAEAVNASGECEELPSNDTQAQHEKSSSQMSQAGDEDPNKLDSLGDVNPAGVAVSKPTEDNLQHAGENKKETEPAASELVQTVNTDCLHKEINRKDFESFEGDDHEFEPKTIDVQNEVTSMGISNSENRDIVLSQLSIESLQKNTEVTAEQDPCATICVKELSPTNTSDSKMEEEDQDFDNEPDMKQASVLSNANEITESIKDLTLNTGLEKDDGDFQTECVSSNASKESTLQGGERDSLEIKGEGLPPAENLLGGNPEIVATSISEDTSSSSRQITSSSNEADENTIGTKSNEGVAVPVPNNQDCTQEIGIGANKNTSSNSVEGKEIGATSTTISENISDECDSDSDDEHEPDTGANKTLTLQPAYHPSPGECSVMSCLSQFCAPELLDGNNKFACEECSKRAHRLKEEKDSNAAGKERSDDDKDDVSDDDECKGAKAAKNKKTEQETVYTVATKQLLISLAPPVLTLHLKRFQQARFTLQKLTKMVDFPLELNLAPFCSRSGRSRADSEGQVLYSLYGIVQHSGNMNSGHYTAYVKVSQPPVKGLYDRVTNMNELTDFVRNMWIRKTQAKHRSSRFRHEPATDGQWFHVSDSSVSAVPETKVLKSQAYMLFYGRLPLGNR